MKASLKETQQQFKEHLVRGGSEILSNIVSTERLSNIDRLAIYGNAYYARLVEVLENDYSTIHTLLGDDEFELLGRRYIEKYPSSFFTLRWFGQHLADFLKAAEPYSKHPYLYEMALFEWRFTDAFDAADASTVMEQDVAQVPPENWPELVFDFHPSVSWLSYHWNILPVWKAVKEGGDVPVLQKIAEPGSCVVWRQGLSTKYRTLESHEAELMQAVAQQKNFSQLCELLVEEGELPDKVPLIIAGFLKTWISQGMITAIRY